MIVELRILELREIERRRVFHEANAHPIREQIAEESLDKLRGAAQRITADGDRELESDEQRQAVPVGTGGTRANHLVDNQLADP